MWLKGVQSTARLPLLLMPLQLKAAATAPATAALLLLWRVAQGTVLQHTHTHLSWVHNGFDLADVRTAAILRPGGDDFAGRHTGLRGAGATAAVAAWLQSRITRQLVLVGAGQQCVPRTMQLITARPPREPQDYLASQPQHAVKPCIPWTTSSISCSQSAALWPEALTNR
jgi:hypothetical protein